MIRMIQRVISLLLILSACVCGVFINVGCKKGSVKTYNADFNVPPEEAVAAVGKYISGANVKALLEKSFLPSDLGVSDWNEISQFSIKDCLRENHVGFTSEPIKNVEITDIFQKDIESWRFMLSVNDHITASLVISKNKSGNFTSSGEIVPFSRDEVNAFEKIKMLLGDDYKSKLFLIAEGLSYFYVAIVDDQEYLYSEESQESVEALKNADSIQDLPDTSYLRNWLNYSGPAE